MVLGARREHHEGKFYSFNTHERWRSRRSLRFGLGVGNLFVIACPSGHPADLFVACALACLLACLLACVLTWWLTCLMVACLPTCLLVCLLAWELVGDSESLQFAPGRPLESSKQSNATKLGCTVGAIRRSHMVIPNDWLELRKPVVR